MENLLHRLLGGDNAKREAAERVINELEKQPEEYMISLISVFSAFVFYLCRCCGRRPCHLCETLLAF